jgi:hypothetical protein
MFLVAATIVATGLAWWGNTSTASTAGRIVGAFLAVTLTGFTIAAAALPRVTYAWLERKDWPFSDGNGVAVVGSHVLLVVFAITNVDLARGHPAYTSAGAVGAVGAALWAIHEALSAKKTHDDARS